MDTKSTPVTMEAASAVLMARLYASRADPLPLRVEQRLLGHQAGDPAAEDVDLDRGARLDVGRQVRVRDRALDGEAVAAGRDPAHQLAADADRLVAEHDGPRVVEHEAAQAPAHGRGRQRVAAEERLVLADAEAEPGLVRRLVRRDVGRPDP